MIINKICITIAESEISNALLAGMARGGEQAEQLKQIKDPRIEFKQGKIAFKCKYTMGFMPVPVEAQIELSPACDGRALAIRLAKVSLAMMGGNSAATALLQQLAPHIAGKPGLALDGDTLTVDLKTLGQMRGIVVNGSLRTIAVCPGTLTLELE